MKVFSGVKAKGQWWFRIFGFGVSAKNTKIYPLLFSERYGYRKGVKLQHWIFHFLEP